MSRPRRSRRSDPMLYKRQFHLDIDTLACPRQTARDEGCGNAAEQQTTPRVLDRSEEEKVVRRRLTKYCLRTEVEAGVLVQVILCSWLYCCRPPMEQTTSSQERTFRLDHHSSFSRLRLAAVGASAGFHCLFGPRVRLLDST